MFKRFAVKEKTQLEFRGEFYNVLNHPNFSNSFSTLTFYESAIRVATADAHQNGIDQTVALKWYKAPITLRLRDTIFAAAAGNLQRHLPLLGVRYLEES